MLIEALSRPGREEFASGSGLRARRTLAKEEPSTEDDDLGTEGDGESSPDII